ncbi:hypothetical protein CMO93_01170 [Candidatus Woesearchaeota archaeon]|nr:hypothetical protein [Candidatus Woesearchaeota archaeon]|tara:strand:+ start:2029 stop:2499 length:471 start_codon:yes stop_codon:yes gene_type:complete
MNLRKATVNDANGISKVLIESYNIKDLEEGQQIFEEERAKSHHYIVAEKDEKIIGIVTWLMHGLPKHQLAELDRIAVLPEYQGKGVAKQLFNVLVEHANEFFKKHNSKLRKLYLLTHADNERAHKFYEKMGFKHETTLKQHYYKDKDEFVFSMFFD